jgi:hypothetical protein
LNWHGCAPLPGEFCIDFSRLLSPPSQRRARRPAQDRPRAKLGIHFQRRGSVASMGRESDASQPSLVSTEVFSGNECETGIASTRRRQRRVLMFSHGGRYNDPSQIAVIGIGMKQAGRLSPALPSFRSAGRKIGYRRALAPVGGLRSVLAAELLLTSQTFLIIDRGLRPYRRQRQPPLPLIARR